MAGIARSMPGLVPSPTPAGTTTFGQTDATAATAPWMWKRHAMAAAPETARRGVAALLAGCAAPNRLDGAATTTSPGARNRIPVDITYPSVTTRVWDRGLVYGCWSPYPTCWGFVLNVTQEDLAPRFRARFELAWGS